jgi:protein involved in polysaccharide export with SLBB domain
MLHANSHVPFLLSRLLACALLALPVLALPESVAAQDYLSANPRGLTEGGASDTAAQLTAARLAAARAAAEDAPPTPTAAATGGPAGPLPPDPALATKPLMFGSQIFSGRFGSEAFSGFNPNYQLAVGDRVHLRLWGAYEHNATHTVDAQGNVFIPSVGPVRVQGVRNADLNRQVEVQVKRTFRSNVGVYATLEAAQPVKIYVTGFVKAPGLYGGLSSDSVLYYLDRAGGVDPDRGSYLEVDVLRNGQPHAKVNLYRFLLEGQIQPLQLQDGDTIVAAARKHIVQVRGEVLNPYIFEFAQPSFSAAEVLAVARPRPGATHLSIVRKIGAETRSEYYPVAQAGQVTIRDGDELTLTSDKFPGTILVRIDGATLAERTLVMPYGAKLRDALARVRPAPQANMDAVQLFRRSVATRQKTLMETSLRSLESYALTSRSSTSEEAALRQREAQQILQFTERARQIQPRGQVLLTRAGNSQGDAGDTLLEDGDVIRIPEQSNLVLVSGEVVFPNAVVFDSNASLEGYVQGAGGYTAGADTARVLVVRQDGSVLEGDGARLQPGDEIMVLPKVEGKRIEVVRGITQILFQIAVVAKTALGL